MLGIVGLAWGLYVQIASLVVASEVAAGLEGLEAGLNDPALQQQLDQSLQEAMKQAAEQAQQQ